MLESLRDIVLAQPYPILALVTGTMLLAGFIRGFVGFGASLIIVMVLSTVYGPLAAVPIATLSGLPAMVQLLPNAVRHSERSFVIPFGIAAFIAAPIGTWFLISTSPEVMKICISAFVLLMVAMLHQGWKLPPGASTGVFTGAGIVSGLVQGSAGVGGPPAVAIALSRGGSTDQQRANVIGAVAALSVCSVPALWLHDLFTREIFLISILLFPLYFGGTWLGARFFSGSGRRHFRNGALLILAVIGVVTLTLAIKGHLTS
jgi:uncharacterized membrane protein YfcA